MLDSKPEVGDRVVWYWRGSPSAIWEILELNSTKTKMVKAKYVWGDDYKIGHIEDTSRSDFRSDFVEFSDPDWHYEDDFAHWVRRVRNEHKRKSADKSGR